MAAQVNWKAIAFGTSRVVAFTMLLVFLANYVTVHWHKVRSVEAPSGGWLALSTIAAASPAVQVWVYRHVFAAHGFAVEYFRAFGLFYIPMLGKYLPGKVWSLVGALYLVGKEGVPKRVILSALAAFMAIGMAASAIVVVVTGAIHGTVMIAPWIGPVLMIALLVCVWPRVFHPMVNVCLRLVGREPITARFSTRGFFAVLLGAVAARLVLGAGFFCLVAGFAPISGNEIWYLIGLYSLGQIAGLLALFAPAGIGVREGVLLVGLQPLVGPGPAIAITAVARLWQTAIELVMAGIGYLALRRTRARPRRTDPAETPPAPGCKVERNEHEEPAGTDAAAFAPSASARQGAGRGD